MRASMGQAMREGEERYQILFKAAPDAIVLIDEEGRFVDANPAACALTGYALDELRAMRIIDVVPPEIHESHLTETGQLREDYPLLCKDGTRKLVAMRTNRVPPSFQLTLLRDVTDQRRLQAQVAQGGQVAIMGQLLGGVAYELNSALSVVICLPLASLMRTRRPVASSMNSIPLTSSPRRSVMRLCRMWWARVSMIS